MSIKHLNCSSFTGLTSTIQNKKVEDQMKKDIVDRIGELQKIKEL